MDDGEQQIIGPKYKPFGPICLGIKINRRTPALAFGGGGEERGAGIACYLATRGGRRTTIMQTTETGEAEGQGADQLWGPFANSQRRLA
ncbi:hypothetical protein D1227_13850 [Henriciella mobilis]|nr:hypothetical protein D1231_10825 [Henriciella mobilis]RIJ20171.1 hypothetical protein D1227_13850 [Henriciella mobilis]